MTHHIDSYDAYCFDQLRNNVSTPTVDDVECACRNFLASEGYTDALEAFSIIQATQTNPQS